MEDRLIAPEGHRGDELQIALPANMLASNQSQKKDLIRPRYQALITAYGVALCARRNTMWRVKKINKCKFNNDNNNKIDFK